MLINIRIYYFISIIFLILYVSFSSCAYAKAFKIATWNIEWLFLNSDIHNYPVPQDIIANHYKNLTKLRHYNDLLNADIIGFQEIGSLDTLKKIFPINKYDFFITHDQILQHTALAIRKNLFYKIVQNPDFNSLSNLHPTHLLRSGLDVTIYNQNTNLRILVIHLKSGCQSNLLNSKKESCDILKKQNIILQQWIKKRLEEKQPFIILGDFNRIFSYQDEFFKDLRINHQMIMPTAGKATPCWGGNYFIDGFIIDPITSKITLNNSIRVLIYKEKGNDQQKELSDHCPVSIKLNFQ